MRGNPESLVDIGIVDGQILSLEENLAADAGMLIDAQGNMVTESSLTRICICARFTPAK
ncbi:MAG TPA: hypothetical protein VI753_04735 [Anaerolineales bacterium]|nr:hypothetical protein [Anaerolineales bacterium]